MYLPAWCKTSEPSAGQKATVGGVYLSQTFAVDPISGPYIGGVANLRIAAFY